VGHLPPTTGPCSRLVRCADDPHPCWLPHASSWPFGPRPLSTSDASRGPVAGLLYVRQQHHLRWLLFLQQTPRPCTSTKPIWEAAASMRWLLQRRFPISLVIFHFLIGISSATWAASGNSPYRPACAPRICVAYSAPVAAARRCLSLIYPFGQGSFSDGHVAPRASPAPSTSCWFPAEHTSLMHPFPHAGCGWLSSAAPCFGMHGSTRHQLLWCVETTGKREPELRYKLGQEKETIQHRGGPRLLRSS